MVSNNRCTRTNQNVENNTKKSLESFESISFSSICILVNADMGIGYTTESSRRFCISRISGRGLVSRPGECGSVGNNRANSS